MPFKEEGPLEMAPQISLTRVYEDLVKGIVHLKIVINYLCRIQKKMF